MSIGLLELIVSLIRVWGLLRQCLLEISLFECRRMPRSILLTNKLNSYWPGRLLMVEFVTLQCSYTILHFHRYSTLC